jgi:hypothetical protein
MMAQSLNHRKTTISEERRMENDDHESIGKNWRIEEDQRRNRGLAKMMSFLTKKSSGHIDYLLIYFSRGLFIYILFALLI